MPFVPTHVTRYELVQYYIKLFYRELANYPARGKTLDAALEVLDRLNEEYKDVLARKYCEWDTPDMQGRFEEHMDFLTGAFSARRNREGMRIRRMTLLREAEAKRIRNEKQALQRRVLEGIEKRQNSQ